MLFVCVCVYVYILHYCSHTFTITTTQSYLIFNYTSIQQTYIDAYYQLNKTKQNRQTYLNFME